MNLLVPGLSLSEGEMLKLALWTSFKSESSQ